VGKVIADQSVSLDGFSAGPNVGMRNGMGDGGEGYTPGSFPRAAGRGGTAWPSRVLRSC